jgi:hypothetical protein
VGSRVEGFLGLFLWCDRMLAVDDDFCAHALRARRVARARSSHLHLRMREKCVQTRDVCCIRGQGGGEDGEIVERESKLGERRQLKTSVWLLRLWAHVHLRHHPTLTLEGGP